MAGAYIGKLLAAAGTSRCTLAEAAGRGTAVEETELRKPEEEPDSKLLEAEELDIELERNKWSRAVASEHTCTTYSINGKAAKIPSISLPRCIKGYFDIRGKAAGALLQSLQEIANYVSRNVSEEAIVSRLRQ